MWIADRKPEHKIKCLQIHRGTRNKTNVFYRCCKYVQRAKFNFQYICTYMCLDAFVRIFIFIFFLYIQNYIKLSLSLARLWIHRKCSTRKYLKMLCIHCFCVFFFVLFLTKFMGPMVVMVHWLQHSLMSIADSYINKHKYTYIYDMAMVGTKRTHIHTNELKKKKFNIITLKTRANVYVWQTYVF